MLSIDLMIVEQVSRQVLMVVLNTSLKGLLIIISVYFLLSFAKKMSARTLHLVWFLSIAGFMILPVISLLSPAISIWTIRVPENSGRVYQTISSFASIDQNFAGSTALVQSQSSPGTSAVQPVSAAYYWTIFFAIWLTGAFAVFSRVIRGNAKANHIVKHGNSVQEEELLSLINKLKARNKVNSSLPIFFSTETGSPFTIGIFNPVIVLPEYMKTWSPADLEPIIVHELHHIKRKDYLTQTAAMAICSIFWFVPAVWIALEKLYLEQENACDAEVVRNGINPRHYVTQMLRIACSLFHPTVSPGLTMINGRRKLFERRIKNILEKRGASMKKKNVIFVAIGFILAIAIFAGCITTKKAISEEDFFAAWSGTWVNSDIEGSVWIPEKIIAHQDGGYDIYVYASDAVNFCHHDIELIDQWIDAKGAVWYTAYGFCRDKGIDGYMYGRISNSGNTLEFTYNTTGEPIDTLNQDKSYGFYCVFQRE